MATYAATGYYQIQYSQTTGQYRIESNYIYDASTITDEQVGDVFVAGQTVKITATADGYEAYETIVAFTSDGIITRTASGLYALQTNNTGYAPLTILDVNTDPFPVCFVAGTLIDTDRGAVPVEALAIGDKVIGSTGVRTVKWIGWRHYHAVSLRTPAQREACTPVRILAGALDDNQPSQDLRVSPWHHLYVDGVLVRANDLINGTSIVQETLISEFSYYHVELDQFDVIRAHDVYSESWADGGNRDFFQNVDVTTLRPEDQKRRKADRPGFTALRKAADIAVIHGKIAARAQARFSTPESKAA